jgi:hypothetical protein
MPPQDGSITILLDKGTAGDVPDERVDPSQFLTVAHNVRVDNGIPRKAPGLWPAKLITGDYPTCHGIVPPPRVGGDAIAYPRPKHQATTVNGYGGAEARSTVLNATRQNHYFPIQVRSSGVAQNGPQEESPAICIHALDEVWTAACKVVNGSRGIYISVDDNDGGRLVGSQLAVGSLATFVWIGLTSHGDTGVRLWYYETGGDVIMVPVSFSGQTLTAGTPITVITPLQSLVVDVVGGHDDYAWLVTRDTVTSTVVQVSRVDVTTGSITAVELAAWCSTLTVRFAIGMAMMAPALAGTPKPYVVVAASDTAALTSLAVIDGDAMTVSWQTTGLHWFGTCAVGISAVDFDESRIVLALQESTNSFDHSTTPPQVLFDARRLSNGTDSITTTAYNFVLHTKATSWNADPNFLSATPEVYPFFSLARSYGTSWPVYDPAVCVVVPARYADGTLGVTPVGRFGANEQRSVLSLSGSVIHANADTLGLMYLHQAGDTVLAPKYVTCDLRPRPVASAGVAGLQLIAAAQPAYWDGSETVEIGPLYRPAITSDTSGGGASLTGTWRYRAVYSYVDSTGRTHRSAPSEVREQSAAAAQIKVFVSVPFSMRNGIRQDDMLVEPALWDVCAVSNRVWAIEAEDRSMAIASKPKSTSFLDVSMEFSAFQRYAFPAGAGRLVAVRDFGGVPVFFAENGIYVIHGEGPDATGNIGAFSEPRLISRYGCLWRESVIETPVGIFFAARTGNETEARMAVLAGGGVQLFDERVIELDDWETACVRCSVMFEPESEVAFGIGPALDSQFDNGAVSWLVFNWKAKTWTTWDAPAPVYNAASIPSSHPLVFLYYPTQASIWRFSSDGGEEAPSAFWANLLPTKGQMRLRTAWIQPNGTMGDVQFDRVLFEGIREGAATITIRIERDFDETAYQEAVWTSSELAAIDAADGRFIISVKVSEQACRAIRVTITEALSTAQAIRPLSITASYGVNRGLNRRVLIAGSIK